MLDLSKKLLEMALRKENISWTQQQKPLQYQRKNREEIIQIWEEKYLNFNGFFFQEFQDLSSQSSSHPHT